MERLIEILESFRQRGHFYNGDDGFYSCPLAENGWKNQNYPERDRCNCGLEKNNALVDEALQIVKNLEKLVYQNP